MLFSYVDIQVAYLKAEELHSWKHDRRNTCMLWMIQKFEERRSHILHALESRNAMLCDTKKTALQ